MSATTVLWILLLISFPWALVAYTKRNQGIDYAEKVVTLPNYTTFIGMIALITYVVADVFNPSWCPKSDQLWFITIAGLSDALDGIYARITKQCSKLGAIIDPVRDRLFILAIMLSMVLNNGTQRETTIVAAATALTILLESTIVLLYIKRRDLAQVHFWGKVRMGVHCLCGMLFVLQTNGMLSVIPTVWLSWIIAGASCVAFLAYRDRLAKA